MKNIYIFNFDEALGNSEHGIFYQDETNQLLRRLMTNTRYSLTPIYIFSTEITQKAIQLRLNELSAYKDYHRRIHVIGIPENEHGDQTKSDTKTTVLNTILNDLRANYADDSIKLMFYGKDFTCIDPLLESTEEREYIRVPYNTPHYPLSNSYLKINYFPYDDKYHQTINNWFLNPNTPDKEIEHYYRETVDYNQKLDWIMLGFVAMGFTGGGAAGLYLTLFLLASATPVAQLVVISIAMTIVFGIMASQLGLVIGQLVSGTIAHFSKPDDRYQNQPLINDDLNSEQRLHATPAPAEPITTPGQSFFQPAPVALGNPQETLLKKGFSTDNSPTPQYR